MQKENTLHLFKQEVLDTGADACLPSNLSDYWLETLSRQADEVLEGSGENSNSAALLAAILHILQAKNESATEIKVPLEKLFDFYQSYRIELGLEEVHRKTDIKYDPATLASIFTDRTVTTWRDDTWRGPQGASK